MIKKRALLAVALMASPCVAFVGCSGEEEHKAAEVKSVESTAAKPGPPAEAGPVDPSPTPSLPATTSPMPDTKKGEAEPKMEPPK